MFALHTKLLSTTLYLLIHINLRLFDLLLFLRHFLFQFQIVLLLSRVSSALHNLCSPLLFLALHLILLKFELV